MNKDSSERSLGQWLRDERARRKQTLAEVAKAIGMQFQHLSKLERGNRPATREQAYALAKHYGLDAQDVEARRMADEFWRENARNPAALAAIGILQEDAGIYTTTVSNL